MTLSTTIDTKTSDASDASNTNDTGESHETNTIEGMTVKETRRALATIRKLWLGSSATHPFYITDRLPISIASGLSMSFESFAVRHTIGSINKRQLKLGHAPELIHLTV